MKVINIRSGTVIPIILIIMFVAPLEKFLKKVIPDIIKAFVVPFLVLVIIVPAGFVLIGPVANMLSDAIGTSLLSITNISPVLAGIVLAGLYQILIVFSVHTGLVMIIIMDLLVGNPSAASAMLAPAGFAQMAAVFAIWLKSKDQNLKENAFPAFISSVFGVTEPAIYGITLPRLKYFVISCIGSAGGGFYIGLTGVAQYQLAGMGIFAIPRYINTEAGIGNLINFLIASGITMVFSGVVTYILFKDDTSVATGLNTEKKGVKVKEISSPLSGTTVSLSDVADGAFSQKTLGNVIAINPESGVVVAPEDGILTTVFPTNHALGITTEDGVEILIHIGMNTVQLEGEHFFAKAKQGDAIKKGQVLMEFYIEAIKFAGYSLITPVIITNTDKIIPMS